MIGIMQGRIFPDNRKILQKFPKMSWKKEFYHAKKIGFRYIELLADKDLSIENPLINGQVYQIKNLKKKYGIKTPNTCLDVLTNFPAEKWKFNYDKIEKNIETIIKNSKKIGVKNFIFPIFFKNVKIINKLLLADIFKFLNSIILKYNIKIFLETNIKLKNIKHLLSKNKKIKICLDLGNLKGFNFDFLEEVNEIKSFIGLIHLKDKKKGKKKNEIVNKGDVDFFTNVQILKKINYKGNFTLETAPGFYPLQNAKINYKIFNKIINNK